MQAFSTFCFGLKNDLTSLLGDVNDIFGIITEGLTLFGHAKMNCAEISRKFNNTPGTLNNNPILLALKQFFKFFFLENFNFEIKMDKFEFKDFLKEKDLPNLDVFNQSDFCKQAAPFIGMVLNPPMPVL